MSKEKISMSDLQTNLYDCLAALDETGWIDAYNSITGDDLTVDDVEWEE
jgi:hypothetical protein